MSRMSQHTIKKKVKRITKDRIQIRYPNMKNQETQKSPKVRSDGLAILVRPPRAWPPTN